MCMDRCIRCIRNTVHIRLQPPTTLTRGEHVHDEGMYPVLEQRHLHHPQALQHPNREPDVGWPHKGGRDAGQVGKGGVAVEGHHGLQGPTHVEPLHVHHRAVANPGNYIMGYM